MKHTIFKWFIYRCLFKTFHISWSMAFHGYRASAPWPRSSPKSCWKMQSWNPTLRPLRGVGNPVIQIEATMIRVPQNGWFINVYNLARFYMIRLTCGHRFLVGTGGPMAGLIGRGGVDMATTLRWHGDNMTTTRRRHGNDATLPPHRRHIAAILPPHRRHIAATLVATTATRPYFCHKTLCGGDVVAMWHRHHVVAMSLSRRRHVVVVSSRCCRHFVAMLLSLRRHVVTMPWPCRRHVVVVVWFLCCLQFEGAH